MRKALRHICRNREDRPLAEYAPISLVNCSLEQGAIFLGEQVALAGIPHVVGLAMLMHEPESLAFMSGEICREFETDRQVNGRPVELPYIREPRRQNAVAKMVGWIPIER